jgi:Mannosyltransferase (PIG-V)
VRRAARGLVSREREAWTLVGLRVCFWAAAVVSLLWAPLHGSRTIPPYHAYGALSDLAFGAFAQWDSAWFLHIAEHGYDSKTVTVFFPVYPLVVHAVAFVVRSTLVACVLVSIVAAFAAATAILRIAWIVIGSKAAPDAVLYVALYPLAFVFTAAYSDGLFLAFAAGAFLAALRGRTISAGVLAALALDTRVFGLALIPPLLVLLWPRGRSVASVVRLAPLLFIPAALGGYMLYLRHRFGDALAFVHAEGDPSWNRHLSHLGPLGGLRDAFSSGWHGLAELLRHLPRAQNAPHGYPLHDTWAAWNVVQLLLLLAALWLTWEAWRRLGAAYGLYSATLLGIVLSTPAAIVPLASEPRYLLVDFPLFIVLASMTQERPALRTFLLGSFAAVGGIAAVAFAHDVWVA